MFIEVVEVDYLFLYDECSGCDEDGKIVVDCGRSKMVAGLAACRL